MAFSLVFCSTFYCPNSFTKSSEVFPWAGQVAAAGLAEVAAAHQEAAAASVEAASAAEGLPAVGD